MSAGPLARLFPAAAALVPAPSAVTLGSREAQPRAVEYNHGMDV